MKRVVQTFVSYVLISTSARADPSSVASETRPIPLIDGTPVLECAWPSVVALTDGEGICTGVYIGERVVVTDAHCVAGAYVVEPTCGGETPCVTCDIEEGDSDCPQTDRWGNSQPTFCNGVGKCESTNASRSNRIERALFGEEVDGHVEESIPVRYCQRRQPPNDTSDATDFAYCLLIAEPNVQPVPVMMDCEADRYLEDGDEVVAVGFGRSIADPPNPVMDSSGIKRFAKATLTSSSSSTAKTLTGFSEWTHEGGGTGAGPALGDSGGPLMKRLPDGTWRVVALAVRNSPLYATIWHNVRWMLTESGDDSVTDSSEVLLGVLPCHDVAGAWGPQGVCENFPMSPDVPSGDWARGEHACHSDAVGGGENTCTDNIKQAPAPGPPQSTVMPSFDLSAWWPSAGAWSALVAFGAYGVGAIRLMEAI